MREYCRIPHGKAVCQLQIGGFYTILQVALEKCPFVWCSVKNSWGIHSPLDGRQAKRLPYRHWPQAEEMFFQLVKDYAQRQGITERLKTENQMEWVGRMNNCKAQAEEVIMAKLIMIWQKCGVIPAFLNNSILRIGQVAVYTKFRQNLICHEGYQLHASLWGKTVFKNISKTL